MLLNGLNVLNFMRIFSRWKKKVTLKKKKKHLRQESEPGLRNGWWGWCGEDRAESHEEEETANLVTGEQEQAGLLPGSDWGPVRWGEKMSSALGT